MSSEMIINITDARPEIVANITESGPRGAKGDPGEQGIQGIQGEPGLDGLTTSVNGVSHVNGEIALTQDNVPDGTTNKAYTATEKTKLSGIDTNANNYSHPTSDGSKHVPANGTTNDGKVLKAGATAGTYVWANDNDTITTINGKTGVIAKADIVALGIPAQDTVYTHPTTAGNKHIPTDGASGQILRYSASGTAVWDADNDTVTTINGKTGAISKADIVALGIPAQDTVYTHPANHTPSIITQDASNRFVTDTEKSTWNGKAESSHTHTKSQITDFPTSMTPTAHNQAGTTITVADSGGYFTGTNAETVLQEIGSTLNGLEAAITAITG